MISTFEPIASHNARTPATALGVRALRRREDAPAVDEQGREAGVRPGLLGARDRMRRHEPARAAAACGASAAITAPLTDPTSETIAPGFNAGAMARPIASLAPTGAQSITQIGVATASREIGRVRRPRDRAPRRGQRLLDETSAIDEPSRRILPPDRARQRRADQPDPDDRQHVEDRRARAAARAAQPRPPSFTNSASAATTPRLASSTPTVSRRHSGSP